MEQNQGCPWERKAERTTVEPGGQPDVFAARTRDPPALLLRDDLNPLHHAKGMLCLTETDWGCLRWVPCSLSIYGQGSEAVHAMTPFLIMLHQYGMDISFVSLCLFP
jgi:hypothetical protein